MFYNRRLLHIRMQPLCNCYHFPPTCFIQHTYSICSGRSSHQHKVLNLLPQKNSLAPLVNPLPINAFREQLQVAGISGLDPTMIAYSIKSCIHENHVMMGAQIHALAVSSGLTCHTMVSNSLMNLYCKTGRFVEAINIFHSLGCRDVVSWNTILSGFSCSEEALEFAVEMAQSGVPFDAVTFTTALAFSSDFQDINFGLQLHSWVLKVGLESDTFVGNALISAYAKAGLVNGASIVFDRMVERDLVSWNALISGYAQEDNCWDQAIKIFVMMMREGLRLDHVSFSSAIAACGHERNLEFGQQIHSLAVKWGLDNSFSIVNVLMSLYSKCGLTACARGIFENMVERNVISWTTMISMDVENAVMLFKEMLLDNVDPNNVTFVAMVSAVSTENDKHQGEMVHGFCVKAGMVRDLNVSNSFITMYAKLQSMEESRRIFDEMNQKGTVSWNALISGYAQNKLCEEALMAFSLMMVHSKPNEFTFGSIISAISSVETVCLTYGQRCHCHILKLGLETNEYVAGALIDMYSKRGSLEESQWLFEQTHNKSLISWTAMISAQSRHGNYDAVITLFKDMTESGICPDQLTFLAVLTACGHRGMVDQGCQIFYSMMFNFQIEPTGEHYSAMVDMLGRAGRLEEAEKLIRGIPDMPSLSALQSLLGACRVHGNVKMASRVGDALMEMGPAESGTYILLSNIYAEMGEWEKVATMRKGMREKGVRKEVGFSWVDIGGRNSMHMHGFSSSDKSHPRSRDIYWMARFLGREIKALDEDEVVRNMDN